MPRWGFGSENNSLDSVMLWQAKYPDPKVSLWK